MTQPTLGIGMDYVIAVAFPGHSKVEMASTVCSTMLLKKA